MSSLTRTYDRARGGRNQVGSIEPEWRRLLSALCGDGGVAPEHLAFVRGPNGRAIILPNNAPSVARSSLLDYRAHVSRKESVAANFLASVFRSERVAQTVLPNLRSECEGEEARADHRELRDLRPLWPVFESLLGVQLMAFSTVLRRPGPDWTPIVHLFGADGERVSIAKIGFSPRARRSIRREMSALRALEAREVSWLTARPLGLLDEEGMTAALMSPLPRNIARVDHRVDANLLAEVHSLPVADDDERHPQHLQRACADLGFDADGDLDETIFADLPRGRCHGDLVPWNTAQSGGRLVIWDWEYSFGDAPWGFDAIQSRYRALREQGRVVEDALRLANAGAQPTLVELGLDARHRVALYRIHAIDAAVRIASGVDVSGAGRDDAQRALLFECDDPAPGAHHG